MLAGGGGERLVGALQDPLGADVDPGPGGHLAVHHEALAVELVEVLPGRPGRDEHRVGDEDAGCVGVGVEDADRLARLHEQRLVVLQLAQAPHDRVEALPVARGLADAAVDDELVRTLRHLGVEVVHEHAEGGFLRPRLAGDLRAPRCPHEAHRGNDGRLHISHRCVSVESSFSRS